MIIDRGAGLYVPSNSHAAGAIIGLFRCVGRFRLPIMARAIVFFVGPLLAAAVTIDTNFEGGSLGRIEKISETHYRLGVKGEKDQDGRNRQANWYYFEVREAPAAEMTLDIVDLPGEYNYRPNRGAITADTPPVISYDQKTWQHVDRFEYDAAEPKLRLRIRPAGSRFWIAHVPPYTNRNLRRLRDEIAGHPNFQEEAIGKTAGGRELVLWTIRDGDTRGKKTVWLMFRQHSWEAGSSWTGEGAVRALMDQNPAGRRLRKRIVWKILPLCDPDGVARGGVRFNVYGYDLNRNWDITDPAKMPEITAQRNAVQRWLAAGHSIDLFLSLHNTETAEYLEGSPGAVGPLRGLGERLFRILCDRTTFSPSRPLAVAQTSTTPGKPGRMTVIQGLYRDFKIPGFLMEQRISQNSKPGHLPEISDRLRFGAELVQAISAALE